MTGSLYSIILPETEADAVLGHLIHFQNKESKLTVKALMEQSMPKKSHKHYQYSLKISFTSSFTCQIAASLFGVTQKRRCK